MIAITPVTRLSLIMALPLAIFIAGFLAGRAFEHNKALQAATQHYELRKNR